MAAGKGPKPRLPIFSILGSVDFSEHFVIIGDVGTGKSTVTPIYEFEARNKDRQIVIREPSRAACNALFYSLQALHPETKDELAVITKDTKINIGGKIKIVTDGVLLRMLAENSIFDSSIYFDESHQMSSQLELCLSLAKKEEPEARNLFRIMSATIDPKEFLSFLGISKLYSLSGRRYPVRLEVELAKDVDDMFKTLSLYLYSQPRDESWLVFLSTRRLVEKYASSYGGVFIHGGLDGSEINRIQQRAELDKNLRIFATNVIASSVNIYVDNVSDIQRSDRQQGQARPEDAPVQDDRQQLSPADDRQDRTLQARSGGHHLRHANPEEDQSDTGAQGPRNRDPVRSGAPHVKVRPQALGAGVHVKGESSRSRLRRGLAHRNRRDRSPHYGITRKGLLMSEIPYEPDFSHVISSALISGDYDVARFLLASGAFGDSLNHAYKSDMEGVARQFLYAFDKSNELNIKARLLKGYSEEREGSFTSRLVANGIFIDVR